MTATEAFDTLYASLTKIYEDQEAKTIADWTLEHITGKKKWQRRLDKIILDDQASKEFQEILSDLMRNKPMQYVLNEAWFCGLRFKLNESVLIPRPETEELVQRVVDENCSKQSLSVLDVGSGSGCIAISIKKKLPQSGVVSVDISESAIRTAKENAENLNAGVQFFLLDFLNEKDWNLLADFDVIVSNPPYIPLAEKSKLEKNVVDFEPEVALFVPDDDPLIFYRKIISFSRLHLHLSGKIYLEVHEKHANDVFRLFDKAMWSTKILKDMFGKDRIVVATFNP